eukprot:tig00000851_g4905.t1
MFAAAVAAPSQIRSSSFAGTSVAVRASKKSSKKFEVTMSAAPFSKKKPSDAEIAQFKSYPTWGCGVSKFDWSYSDRETCYVLEGDVTVTDDKTGQSIHVEAGDLATFEAGLSCVWDVKKPIKKHYKFG